MRWLRCVVSCLLVDVRYASCIVFLFVTRCVLVVVCCMLFDVCRLLCVVGCV